MTTTVEYGYTEAEWQQRLAAMLTTRARRKARQAAVAGILKQRRKAGLRRRHAAKLARPKGAAAPAGDA